MQGNGLKIKYSNQLNTKNIVLVTGATSGIGKSTAFRFAREGHPVIITGRRKSRLSQVAAQISSTCHGSVLSLDFDIRSRKQCEDAVASLPDEWKNIAILVNNSGLALGLEPVHLADPDDWDQMIDTNIKGLLYMTRAVLPLMLERGQGHIINIGSIAGKEVYPSGNVYSATKFAVDALSKGMRIDLLSHGIKVSQISPGAVETEFSAVRFKGDTERASKVYRGYSPLKPEDVAEAIYYVTTVPAHVNINDLVIMPAAQAGSMIFNKNIPNDNK